TTMSNTRQGIIFSEIGDGGTRCVTRISGTKRRRDIDKTLFNIKIIFLQIIDQHLFGLEFLISKLRMVIQLFTNMNEIIFNCFKFFNKIFHYSFLLVGCYFVVWIGLPLCAVVLFYGPLTLSMCLHLVQCAVILFYVPSSRSMCRYSVLCAFISFNVPLFCSMDLHLALCSVVLFYGPSSHSMFRPPVLWTSTSLYVNLYVHMNNYTSICINIHTPIINVN